MQTQLADTVLEAELCKDVRYMEKYYPFFSNLCFDTGRTV